MDLDGYRFGSGHSIDTDVPPAFLDAYYGDDLLKSDPFVTASMSAAKVIVEEEVYAERGEKNAVRRFAAIRQS